MFSFRTTPLESQEDRVLHRGKLGVFCNQSAWNPETGEYTFESFYRRGNLLKVFSPAGEFPEDSIAAFGLEGCTFCSIKNACSTSCVDGMDEVGEIPDVAMFDGLDALVVDYQDTGSRYDSSTMLLYRIFQLIHHGGSDISVYIVDRENMCGRSVEGTALISNDATTVGLEGIPHRHGLTIGELAGLFYSELGAKFPLHIISYTVRASAQMLMPWSVPTAKYIAGLFTSNFHCGMQFLSGTDISCGEGTLRPYEVFGAPYMKSCMALAATELSAIEDPAVFLRRTVFVPTSGLYKGETCYGFQLLPKPGVPYHSVAHTLRILRFLYSEYPMADFSGLDKIVGDAVMTAYVSGTVDWNDLKEHIKVEEQKWIRKARRQMLYEDTLSRVKTLHG